MQRSPFLTIFLESVAEVADHGRTLLQAPVLPALCMWLIGVVVHSVELNSVGHAIAWKHLTFS